MNYLKLLEVLAVSDTQEFNMIKTKEYANYIDNLYPQYYTINPAEVVLPTLCDWEDYMCICLHLLKQCDAIFMLPDWKESNCNRWNRDYPTSPTEGVVTHGSKAPINPTF